MFFREAALRFSEHFQIGKTQAELDFVDIVSDEDLPLFIDPYTFSVRNDAWSEQCNNDIVSYFQALIDHIRAARENDALRLLGGLSEPNETCLGVSRGRPSGRGVGGLQAKQLYDALNHSQAAQTGTLSSLSECELYVEGIGPDKISDLTTNIIRGNLIRYTQEQCRLHGINLHGTVASGRLWSAARQAWTQDMVPLPVIQGKKIVLVPKASVRWSPAIDHRTFYNHFVLNFLQMEHIEAHSGLVHTLRSGMRRVFKTELKQHYPLSKEFLRQFAEEHPQVLDGYKRAIGKTHEVTLIELEQDFDEGTFADVLIRRLHETRPGAEMAADFHRLMIGTLEFIFYPDLIYPIKELEIHEGRKRIDIVYTNSAIGGFFFRRRAEANVGANMVIVECKNYRQDVANPELDQIGGRFSPARGKLGLLIARQFENRERFIAACRDTARDNRGFVVPLVDADIVAMLELIRDRRRGEIDHYMERLFRYLLG